MPALFLYLLKANVALLLLFGLYYFAFRKLTFYQLNRWYFLGTMLFSTIYPFLDIEILPQHQQVLSPTISGVVKYWPKITVQPESQGLDLWSCMSFVFVSGVLLMAGRLLVQFASLYRLHQASSPDQYQQFSFRSVQAAINPFSFGRSIYLHPGQHTSQEIEFILQHEQVHVKQFHTLDVLFTELMLVFFWYNPVAWLLQRLLKENLEFITDYEVLKVGFNKKQYQYALLRALSPSSLSLASPFYVVPLKNRIIMMNKIPSKSAHLLKLFLVPPALATLLVFNGNEVLGNSSPFTLGQKDAPSSSNQEDNDIVDFLRHNPTVKGLSGKDNQILVHLKSGKTESFPTTPEGIAEFEKKYGKLPAPPPPFHDVPKDFAKRNPTVTGLSDDQKNIYILYKSGDVEKFPSTPEGRAAFENKFGILPPPPPPVPGN